MLAIKTKTETQKSEPTIDAKSVEPSRKDVDNLLVTVSFFLRTRNNSTNVQQSPTQRQPSMRLSKRRRAEVRVSTLSAEQSRERVEAQDKELKTFVKCSVV